jgi:hypothetical protein
MQAISVSNETMLTLSLSVPHLGLITMNLAASARTNRLNPCYRIVSTALVRENPLILFFAIRTPHYNFLPSVIGFCV